MEERKIEKFNNENGQRAIAENEEKHQRCMCGQPHIFVFGGYFTSIVVHRKESIKIPYDRRTGQT